MFINFPSHPKIQTYSGLDLSPFRQQIEHDFPELIEPQDLLFYWTRTWMGMKASPYFAAKYYYIMEEMVVGDPLDPNKAFFWDDVILNLPGMESFNPTLPFVFKWDSRSQRLAAAIRAYVDDLRVAAATVFLAWSASRQVASRLQYFGTQDAPRKRRLDGGSWAGTVFYTEESEITKSVTNSKWEKAQNYLHELRAKINNGEARFEYKWLEKIRGFLCHLAMTYDIIFPYLKGFHLTLAQHLPRRHEEGWKMSELHWIGYIEDKFQNKAISEAQKDQLLSNYQTNNLKPPKYVKLLPRFHS